MANQYILGLSMIHSTKNEKKKITIRFTFLSLLTTTIHVLFQIGAKGGGGGGGLGGHDPLDFPKIPFTTSIFYKNIKKNMYKFK